MTKAARFLRAAAWLVAAHGLLILACTGLQRLIPNAFSGMLGDIVQWVLTVPALLLTLPFTPLFWRLELMDTAGWFAWPKPLGMALAYAAWIAVLWGAAWLAARRVRTRADSAAG